MSYLLTQMFLYMLATFILGLILGWLFWRYGKAGARDYELVVNERDTLRAERDTVAGERDAIATEHGAMLTEREALNTNLDASRTRAARERDAAEELRAENARLTAELEECRSKSKATAIPAAALAGSGDSVGTKPQGLDGPRGGTADELQRINGIGPKLEGLLHTLGYFHFDQIAAWTHEELAWVDSNLEGFKGRASRDEWIRQAADFASR